jgi:hypothetical protein
MKNTITNHLHRSTVLLTLAIILTATLVGTLFTSSGNVVSADFGAEGAAPAWSLDGAWMMRTITDWGPVLEPIIFSAQDIVGQRYTMLMEDAECWYTFEGMFPTATDHSHLAGVCVRTGPQTFESTVVGFVVERGPDAPDKILYQRVVTHAFQFVDENNIVATSSWAHYTPDQDADHDGFPDQGQEPFVCLELETTMKRVVLIPPCVPSPTPPSE